MQKHVFIAVTAFLLTQFVYAIENKSNISDKYFLRLYSPFSTFRGDLNGYSLKYENISGNSMNYFYYGDMFFLPSIESGIGLGISLGKYFDQEKKKSLELGYIRLNSTGKYSVVYSNEFYPSIHISKVPFHGNIERVINSNIDANWDVFCLDGKYCFNNNEKICPYVLLGIFYQFLEITNSYAKRDNTGILLRTGDAFYKGYGMNIGSGFSYDIGKKTCLTLDVIYRLSRFTDVKAKGTVRGYYNTTESFDTGYMKINDNINADAVSINIGVKFSL